MSLVSINSSRRGRRAVVVNASKPHYNLGAAKLSSWLRRDGWTVDEYDGDPGLFSAGADLVAVSVIFSWHARLARELAIRHERDAEVIVGGPGMLRLASWWTSNAPASAQLVIGLDWRFERERGNYRMTFASRGCPVGCWFCSVPQLEGKTFTLDHEFEPAPILCDNNLSALPVEFQQHIIERYRAAGVRLLDANSGFEPATFDGGTFERWKPLLEGPWRFAYDYLPETRAVERVAGILAGVRARRKRVYVLIGNEPLEACFERAIRVIELGCEPHCQPVIALDSLDGAPIIRYDWTRARLVHFARYFNRFAWRYASLREYDCRGVKPFADLDAVKYRVVLHRQKGAAA